MHRVPQVQARAQLEVARLVAARERFDLVVLDLVLAVAAAVEPAAREAERVAQPFRDAYAWMDSLFGARAEAERLRAENRDLRARAIQNEFARQENETLRSLLDYIEGPRFPEDFSPVVAEVFSRPPGAFTQAIVIAAGARDGVRVNDPVLNADGLVGLVTLQAAQEVVGVEFVAAAAERGDAALDRGAGGCEPAAACRAERDGSQF